MKEEIREKVKSILTRVTNDLGLSIKELKVFDGLDNDVKYLDCIIELQNDEKIEFVIQFENNTIDYRVKNSVNSEVVNIPLNNRRIIVDRLERENHALHDLFSKM